MMLAYGTLHFSLTQINNLKVYGHSTHNIHVEILSQLMTDTLTYFHHSCTAPYTCI